MEAEFCKAHPEDLAILGGDALFKTPISTSNLVRPSFNKFLDYSTLFFNEGQYQIDGRLIQLFEERMAKFHCTEYCVAVSNGFWALVLAIKCLAIPDKTEVVMPSFTYRRLADVVAWTKLKPHFCEVDEATLAMSPQAVSACINENTALILGVHPIVNTCDAFGLMRVAEQCNLPLLFDAVESVYETVAGRKVGSFGNAECFSMHASKLINGFEGGYITTNDKGLAQRLMTMRDFGLNTMGGMDYLGINARLSELHAAMGLANMDDLEDQVLRNAHRYHLYQQGLESIQGVRLLPFDTSEKTSFKTIVVELTQDWPLTRAETIAILNKEGVLARAYYSPPLHLKPMRYPYVPAKLPLTERLSERFILLPCGHLVSDAQLEDLFKLLKFILMSATKIKEMLP